MPLSDVHRHGDFSYHVTLPAWALVCIRIKRGKPLRARLPDNLKPIKTNASDLTPYIQCFSSGSAFSKHHPLTLDFGVFQEEFNSDREMEHSAIRLFGHSESVLSTEISASFTGQSSSLLWVTCNYSDRNTTISMYTVHL